jgi:hypothetical protein
MMRALVLACTLGLAACGTPPNHLSGSLSEVYSLDFSTVTLQQVGSFVVVAYVQADTNAKTAKLSVDLTALTVTPGRPIDLTGPVAGGPRGTLQRIVDTTIDLPIQLGTVTFDQAPTVGAHLSGSFAATLSDLAGRTLDGGFDGTLVQP